MRVIVISAVLVCGLLWSDTAPAAGASDRGRVTTIAPLADGSTLAFHNVQHVGAQTPGQEGPEPEASTGGNPWVQAGSDTNGLHVGAGSMTPGSAAPTSQNTDGTDGDSGSTGNGDTSVRPTDCLVTEIPHGPTPITPGLDGYDIDEATELIEDHRYYMECWYEDTGDLYYADAFVQPPPGQQQPMVNIRALARTAHSRVPFPTPRPRMAPPADTQQLVGVATWLWLEPTQWQPVHATAGVPDITVTATATPSHTTWNMGDGTTITCHGPGTPWTPDTPETATSDCTHTYQTSSAHQPDDHYTGTVTITWTTTWEGAGQTGTLPDTTSTTPITLTVAEAQALVTNGP